MLEEYADFCYDQVGEYSLEYIDYFEDLDQKLVKAGLNISLPEYVSVLLFSTLAAAVTGLVVFPLVFLIIHGLIGLIYGLGATIILTAITFVGIYSYPNIVIGDRRAKIRDTLPFATLYMSTMAGTGTEPAKIFKSLSKREEYGEVAEEAAKIHQDVETFGTDISLALKKAAKRSPSEDFEDLMWGLNNVITSGGDMRSFLEERSQSLMDDYEQRVQEFGRKLGLLVQIYVTLVILGSIVFISMSVVMTTFTGAAANLIVLIQVLAIFLGLPIISLIFIIMVEGITPGGVD